MRQSLFAWFGLALLLVPTVFAAVFGLRAALEQSTMPLFVVAGALGVLAGRVAAVELGSVSVSWRQLLGGSYLLVAFANALSFAGMFSTADSTASLVAAGGAVVGSLCLAFMGIDIARDGRHFQVTGNVDRVLSL
ncbi:hypothetical protein [Halorubellus sp. PRR65]|uniref:hypothetical protein n=1 Tax=Halorubellus sp. PRR65 TaxID=3098148 RepID=UPI002B257FE8|nr:hypothetical protein [Halorubellus sp. PRR65]